MKNFYSKILFIALLTHLILIFFGPYIVMNQLDRNIADAIANPYEGCEAVSYTHLRAHET